MENGTKVNIQLVKATYFKFLGIKVMQENLSKMIGIYFIYQWAVVSWWAICGDYMSWTPRNKMWKEGSNQS